MTGEGIAIRSVQHYMYCPHRWGLIEIDKAWAENAYVTKANLIHQRAHDPERIYVSRGKRVFPSVWVYLDDQEHDLYGVVDCLELTENGDGVSVNGSLERYRLCIVEYKPTQPKHQEFHKEDLMQVFAQKLCVDYVFGCDCDAVIYYADVKKRIPLPLRENYGQYDQELKRLLGEMRLCLASGKIPEIRKGQKCNGCSMKDLCMPKLKRGARFRQELEQIRQADREEERWERGGMGAEIAEYGLCDQ